MIAIYHWEQGKQFALYAIEVADSETETFFKAVRKQNYPIPDDGSEILFLENNQIVDQRFI